MATKLPQINRTDILDLIDDARAKKKNKKTHVREKLVELYPELETATVRRNARDLRVIDLLVDDVDSYG